MRRTICSSSVVQRMKTVPDWSIGSVGLLLLLDAANLLRSCILLYNIVALTTGEPQYWGLY